MDLESAFAGIRSFTGQDLRQVAFPLGGIGTGTISLGGRGDLRDWEIFNRPAKGRHLPYTFFALWCRPAGGPSVARVLERQILPPYDAGFGLPTGQVSGLPRLKEATFRGAYPFAWIDFEDNSLPVSVSLEALNPFVPMDADASGLPVALFTWSLHNPGPDPVEVSLCLSMLNACGYDGQAHIGNRHFAGFGRNLNEFVQADGLSGLRMSSTKPAPDCPSAGTMAMATTAADVTTMVRWERAGWWDDVQHFWDDFRDDGRLRNDQDDTPSPDGQTDVGSLAAHEVIAPGETRTITFIVSWRFPNLTNYWNSEAGQKGSRLGNWYAAQWPTAWDAAVHAASNLGDLRTRSLTYARALHGSSLPPAVVDAASANASIMRTTTCIRTEDGRFHGFEGCGDNGGCCPMNCTHVWNYEQALAHLFPELERSVRTTDFLANTRPNGDMAFRTLLPLTGNLWAFKPAADGQMGTIMKVYREWLQCGDEAFLAELWPGVERALEFAWSPGGWDPGATGVMTGEQHNTYDIEFYGPNTMMGTFYLGALRAAEEMALALGHTEKAAAYRAVFERGSSWYGANLWNGAYYDQQVIPPTQAEAGAGVDTHAPGSIQPGSDELRYQYGPGCLADHMLGQWFARVVGLGDLLPADQVKQATASIFAHNFRRDLSAHESVQRVYALNDEAGLLLCTWPNGGRPTYPFPYADEVWTGIEYQVAAHLMYEGHVAEGLEIVEAVRHRHNGRRRNPWNEFECGHHYARAMSSWSLILALSGYHYNASRKSLSMDPQVNAERFRCFVSAGQGWGTYSQTINQGGATVALAVLHGEVSLQELCLPSITATEVVLALDGRPVPAGLEGTAIRMGTAVTISAGSTLTAQLR